MRRITSLLLSCILGIGMFGRNTVFVQAKETADSVVASMTIEQKLAQMIMPSLRTWNDQDLTAMNGELSSVLAKYDFGGVILFSQNTKDATQTTELINGIQKAHLSGGFKSKLFVAIDQEGGRVTRLQTGTKMPGNMALAATGNATNAFKAANVIGRELAVQGFNLDFAPVVDVNNNPENPVIGVRSFSDDPAVVARFGAQFVKGLHSQKVMACLKHFPGHGDTNVDSHTGLPVINKTYEELVKNELVPYVSLASNADFIMTAHIQYPQIEKDTYVSKANGQKINLPATLSKKILTGILRENLGYKGLIITDSMEMKAISDNFDKVDASAMAINAGADMILMPVQLSSDKALKELDAYMDGLLTKVKSGEISEDRINESVKRIIETKNKYGLLNTSVEASSKKAADVVGSRQNKAVEWEIAKAGVTAVKNDGVCPIEKDKKVVVFYPQADQLGSIQNGIDLAGASAASLICYGKGLDSSADSAIQNADVVVCLSTCATGEELHKNTEVKTLVEKTKLADKKIVVLSTNLPYDLRELENADALVACYGPGINVTAAIYKLF